MAATSGTDLDIVLTAALDHLLYLVCGIRIGNDCWSALYLLIPNLRMGYQGQSGLFWRLFAALTGGQYFYATMLLNSCFTCLAASLSNHISSHLAICVEAGGIGRLCHKAHSGTLQTL